MAPCQECIEKQQRLVNAVMRGDLPESVLTIVEGAGVMASKASIAVTSLGQDHAQRQLDALRKFNELFRKLGRP